MKALQILTMIAVLALGFVFFAMERPGKGQDSDGPSSHDDARIAAIEKSLAELASGMKEMREQTSHAGAPARSVTQTDIDMAVAKAIEAREAEKMFDEQVLGKASEKKAAAPAAVFDLRATMDTLAGNSATLGEREALWRKVREMGKMDEVLDAFEERAADNPENADVQAQLGYAYIQKLQTVPEGPEKGTWAIKADSTFDKSLKLDDHNWQARFLKATSLAFWPPVFGKQPEAIKHFEILIEQQEASKPKPSFAQTYIFLGNLYNQQGKADRAQDIYKKGLMAFPDDQELKKQLSIAGSK